MRSSDDVRRILLEDGVQAEDAVAAFSGMYPVGGGYGNGDMLFTRCRAIARNDGGLVVWAIKRFGGRPLYRLSRWPLEDFKILRRGLRYDRVALGDQRFWVHRRHREVVESWARA